MLFHGHLFSIFQDVMVLNEIIDRVSERPPSSLTADSNFFVGKLVIRDILNFACRMMTMMKVQK